MTMEEFVTFEAIYADLLQPNAATEQNFRRRKPAEPVEPVEEPPKNDAPKPKPESESQEPQPPEKTTFLPRSEGRSARARRRSQRLSEQAAQETATATEKTAEPETSTEASPMPDPAVNENPAPPTSRRMRRAGRHQEPEITDENAASLLRSRRRNRNSGN